MPIELKPRDPLDLAQEVPGGSLADVLTQLAEAVAEGQARLDLSSAEVAKQLADARVSIVPAIRQIIEPDGTMRFEQAAPIQASLLDLGLQPTFYAFSEATAEIAMDLKVVETATEQGQSKKQFLFAGTRSLRTERRLNREIRVYSKLSAKLVPVPAPQLLGPARTVEDRRPGGGV